MGMKRRFQTLTPKPVRPRGGAPAQPESGSGAAPPPVTPNAHSSPGSPARPVEHGGPEGPEPTRYGDWERGGICYDF